MECFLKNHPFSGPRPNQPNKNFPFKSSCKVFHERPLWWGSEGQEVVCKDPAFLAVVIGYSQSITYMKKMIHWVWGILHLRCSWESQWRQPIVCFEALIWMSNGKGPIWETKLLTCLLALINYTANTSKASQHEDTEWGESCNSSFIKYFQNSYYV